MQLGSCVELSAMPAIWPRSFAPEACPLLPPSVGSALIEPFFQAKPSTAFGTLSPQKFSPSGSYAMMSDVPTMRPVSAFTRSWTPLFGPPSVPRSWVLPPRFQRAACCVASPESAATPVAQVRLFIELATPNVPPRVPSTVNWYPLPPVRCPAVLIVFGAPGETGWKPDPPLHAVSKPATVPAKRNSSMSVSWITSSKSQ